MKRAFCVGFFGVLVQVVPACGENSLSGIVVAPDYAPLPGATVVLHGEGGSTQVISDVDGIYAMTGLVDGVYDVEVHPPMGVPYASAPDELINLGPNETRTRVGFRLPAAGLLAGQILDIHGSPVAGLPVSITGVNGFSSLVEATDAEGRFLAWVPVGPVMVSMEELGASHCFAPIRTGFAEPGVTNHLPASTAYTELDGGSISGTVTNPGGSAHVGTFIVGAYVPGTMADEELQALFNPVSADVPSSGAFAILSLPPGMSYDLLFGLMVSDGDGDLETLTIRETRAGVSPGSAGVVFVYPGAGRSLEGSVLDNGDGVAGAVVMLESDIGEIRGYTETDADGAFVFYNLVPGDYVLRTFHPRFQSHRSAFALGTSDRVLPPADLLARSHLDLYQPAPGEPALRWLHHPGATFGVEAVDDPSSSAWSNIEPHVSLGAHGLNTWTDDGAAGSSRCYRLVEGAP